MSNLFRELKALLPAPALQVATVASVNADGTVTVTFPGGAQSRVRGTGTVDGKVFVRNGLVEGDAPNLPAVTLDV